MVRVAANRKHLVLEVIVADATPRPKGPRFQWTSSEQIILAVAGV